MASNLDATSSHNPKTSPKRKSIVHTPIVGATAAEASFKDTVRTVRRPFEDIYTFKSDDMPII